MKKAVPWLMTILVLASAFLFSSCKVKSESAEAETRQRPVISAETPKEAEEEPVEVREWEVAVGSDTIFMPAIEYGDTSLDASAHRQYLDDPMVFSRLPDQGVSADRTAVVGSRVCLFYPDARLTTGAELPSLPEGIPVPFGTILPIKGRVEDDSHADQRFMFSFQDNWNWFYSTVWDGREGLVFGADLRGVEDTPENNRVTARLYLDAGAYREFYPVIGYRKLSPGVVKALENDRLCFQNVESREYSLFLERPDDMISLYQNHSGTPDSTNPWKRCVPVFMTTDLAAHCQHLVFDRLLQYLEEEYFFPRLRALCDSFIARIESLPQEDAPAAGRYRETREKALLYFQVAKALLDLAPVKQIEVLQYGREEVVYGERKRETVLAPYPETVRAELSQMNAAAGYLPSPVFTFADGSISFEDYSQYKPRGHYTKNGILSSYFMAMMWFGRINFLIADEGPAPLPVGSERPSDSLALTLAMEPIALLLTDIVSGDSGLREQWSELFDPITALIGESDDLSFNELLPLWEELGVDDFASWCADNGNLIGFMKKAHEKLRPPFVSGSSVWWGPSEGTEGERKPPMGWRLFGQRFTFDSYIHDQVSPPRLMSRDMVRGLDVMKAFGSKTADALLAGSDYPKMPGLEERLDELEAQFASQGDEFWNGTYYNQILSSIGSQARFEPGTGFFFTESRAWGVKAMLSAHGTWAELRHDTILYVKQSAAERAGDGDFEPTFRTEPVPKPVHYIEPNLPYWSSVAMSVAALAETLSAYDLVDQETAMVLRRLLEVLGRIIGIVRLEIADQAVPAKDVDWISYIPDEFARLVLIHTGDGYVDDKDQLRMALVADVFTNFELKLVLETAVGIPYRIYVPLNDRQGGKRIAVGYCFNYYEFHQPMSNRLTDEAWKERVYGGRASDLEDDHPFWARKIALPAEAGD